MTTELTEILKPDVIPGGRHSDERGIVSFVNDFRFEDIKRFYSIEHRDTQTIRAWQGHRREEKWFYVVQGSFMIAWVKIDNWEKPDAGQRADHKLLYSKQSEILHIPGGYANGFRALEPHSKLIVFSNFTVEESSSDDYRFSKELWFNWTN